MHARIGNKHIVVALILASLTASQSHVNMLPSRPCLLRDGQSAVNLEVKEVFTGSLTHTIWINNSASGRITGASLYLPLVGNITARQYILLANITSSLGTPRIINDDSGNAYASWENLVIEKGQSVTAEVNYRVISFAASYQMNSSLIGNYNESSQLYSEYTRPEELIQSNAPEIIAKTVEIADEQNTTLEKASRIYRFIITRMHYAIQNHERGALWALQNGTGDCSEYSYLFVALCRAARIPARIQTGFAFHFSSETTEDGHMWAEYYVENCGWIPVDATWNQVDSVDKRHFTQIRGKPDSMPYSNFFFNYTNGPDEDELEESQMATLRPLPPNALNNTALETIARSVQRIAQTRPILSLAETVASLIFRSDTEEMRQTFHESQEHVQDAILNWQEHPEQAQIEGTVAIQTADNALKKAWTAIAFMLAIAILALLSSMAIIIAFSRRPKKNQRTTDSRGRFDQLTLEWQFPLASSRQMKGQHRAVRAQEASPHSTELFQTGSKNHIAILKDRLHKNAAVKLILRMAARCKDPTRRYSE